MSRQERIMVVEDDPAVSDVLCSLLKANGYRPEPIYDGLEAVDRVPGECPDAILLDVMLPGLSGFDVCRILKFRRETNLIPIMMLTALHDKESRRSGLRVGANRYLTKPFDPNTLFHELHDLLEHHRKMVAGEVRTHVELHMESDSQLREQLNDMLDELFQLTPLTDEEIGRIRYAVMEMTENAIEWGNRRKRDLMVTIAYEVRDDHLKFIITDEGPGFNPTDVPHAASEEDPVGHLEMREKLGLRDGGFGILITRGMVDKVEYNSRGNQVSLTKFFPKQPVPDPPCVPS